MTKEEQRAYNRAYYAKHRERLLERFKQWKAENRTAHRATSAKWQAENPEASRALKAAYKRRHPERARYVRRTAESMAAHAARESARNRKKGPISHEVAAFYKAARNTDILFCYWCDSLVMPKQRHVDHINPLSRGGAHEIGNLAATCNTCNLRKGAMPPELFRGRVRK